MLTAPLTTSHFRDRVFALFEDPESETAPNVTPLTKYDTDFGPGELTSQLLAVASPWIDLCSADPFVYNISRQVLQLEVAYAAFCGVAYIIVPGPNLHSGTISGDGVAQYAYTMQEILEIGLYHHVLVRIPMSDSPDRVPQPKEKTLALYARSSSVKKANGDDGLKSDAFGTWDAWNIIRSICKYNNRLFVGKIKNKSPQLTRLRSYITLSFRNPCMFVSYHLRSKRKCLQKVFKCDATDFASSHIPCERY